MRISDWSSDVCSSDLCLDHHRDAQRLQIVPDAVGRLAGCEDAAQHGVALGFALPEIVALGEGAAQDRKSVVWGKSGSVRVDLGGRRIIKKKTKTNISNTLDTTRSTVNL